MKMVTEINQEDFEKLLKKDPLGKIIDGALFSIRSDYHLKDHSESYKINNKESEKIIQVAGLHEYVNERRLKPVYIKGNNYEADVGFAMLFDKPNINESISEIIIGIGFFDGNLPNLAHKISDSVKLWPWANGEIHITNNPKKAKMWYNCIECSDIEYCTRGIAQKVYRSIINGIEQKEGFIHHRYCEYDANRIIDFGGKKLSKLIF